MTEQENKQEQQEPTEEISAQDTQESSQEIPAQEAEEKPRQVTEEFQDTFKETTEKLWGSTKQAWTTATFKANQYKRIVQKKIDLSAIHKKIGAAHTDLGKLIDELREQGKKNILNITEVKELLQRLDSLKATAAAMEEELENINASDPVKEDQP